MRLGRSKEYGHLTCGGCSEATRDKMRCPLTLHGKGKRPPREPAAVPSYRVEMGGTKRAELFRSCPYGECLTPEATRHLTTFGFIKRFDKWPPGREDPQLYEAVSLLQREHDAIDEETRKQ